MPTWGKCRDLNKVLLRLSLLVRPSQLSDHIAQVNCQLHMNLSHVYKPYSKDQKDEMANNIQQLHFSMMLQPISNIRMLPTPSVIMCAKTMRQNVGALFWSAKRNDAAIWVYDRARTPEPGLEWWFEHFTCSGSSESGNKNISLGRNTLSFFFFVPCPNVWFKTKYVPFKTTHESNTLLDHSPTSSISYSSNIPGIFTLECPIADDCSWRRTL